MIKFKNKQLELLKARHQFSGFGLRSKGYGVRELVRAMGLTKDEFESMKEYIQVCLTPNDFDEVIEYYEEII